jgi:hypothetical protein
MRSGEHRGRSTWMNGETENGARRELPVTAGSYCLAPATGQPTFRPGYPSR